MANSNDRGGARGERVDDQGGTPGAARSDPILTLDNVARMFKVGRMTLRYYEWHGLIKRRYRIANVPVYGWADCDRIAFFIKCQRAGLPRREILRLVAATNDRSEGSHERAATQCLALIERLDRRRQLLNEGLAELRLLHRTLSTNPSGSVDGPWE
jgi:DNA-binding transcriptional MerR regulator